MPEIKPVNKDNIGESGTLFQSGKLYEEYLGKLQNAYIGASVYDKMRRSDSEIARVIRVISTPIKSAQFVFEEKDLKDEKQIFQAKFKNFIFKECIDWDTVLYEVLNYLVYGFAVFEKIYTVKDTKEFGQITTLKSLSSRKQSTIYEWNRDKSTGELESIIQYISQGDSTGYHTIPSSDVLLFTNQKEGNNFEGISLLRTIYANYLRKDLYLRLDMMGLEKNAIGTPVIFLPQSLRNNASEFDKVKKVLSSYVAHEKQYLILPDELKKDGFEIKKGEYNSTAVDKSIEREDFKMISSILANFLDIGTLQSGGNSQSDILKEMFLQSIQHIGKYISSVFSKEAHHIFVMNYGEPEVKLDMRATGISKKDIETLAKVVSELGKSQFLTPDENTESYLRKEVGLPKIIENKTNVKPKEVKIEDTENKKVENKKVLLNKNDELIDIIQKSVDVKAIKLLFDDSEQEYNDVIKRNLNKMQAKYINDLKVALNQSNPVGAISSIDIGFTGKLTTDLKQVLNDAYAKAQKQATKEIKAKMKLEKDGIIKRISSKIIIAVRQIVRTIQTDFENNSTLEAINQIDRGEEKETIINKVDASIATYIASKTAYKGSGATVNKFINNGRNNFFFENLDVIQGFMFSAVLDGGTTDICRSLDKQVFLPKDAVSLQFTPPLHWYCRSILVPITPNMTLPNVTGLEVKDIVKKGKVIPASEILKQKQF